jgi:hypothetical protein
MNTLPLVLGTLALVGFSTLMSTVVRKTPKEHALALSEILRKNPNTPEMNSKLAAYMFAGVFCLWVYMLLIIGS